MIYKELENNKFGNYSKKLFKVLQTLKGFLNLK